MRVHVAAALVFAALASACGPVDEPSPPPADAGPSAALDEDGEDWEPMVGALPGDRIPQFTATVRRPSTDSVKEEPLDSHGASATTLYIVNSTTCPACDNYLDRMKELETVYMPRGVDVIHVYPNRSESDAEKVSWHAEQGFVGGQILDTDAAVAKALEADRTPTVCVIGADGIVVYRGAIDDSPLGGGIVTPFLAYALDAHLAGREVEVSATEPSG